MEEPSQDKKPESAWAALVFAIVLVLPFFLI